MLTKYGTDNIIVMIGVGLILIIISLFLKPVWLSFTILFLGFILIAFTSYFFRDPVRHIPDEAKKDPSIILAPADGKIIEGVLLREGLELVDSPEKADWVFLNTCAVKNATENRMLSRIKELNKFNLVVCGCLYVSNGIQTELRVVKIFSVMVGVVRN